MTRTAADYMAEALTQAGVKRIYGVVGDSLNGLVNRAAASKHRRKTGTAVEAKTVVDSGPAQVGVHQQHAHIALGENARQVGRNGRFSFRRRGAGHRHHGAYG